jgi:23S rRNA G2445 N2-methylase RlmL
MSTAQAVKTAFTFRLRPPPGLEKTLMKELKLLRDIEPRKIPGRNILEVTGPEETLWQLMYKSRIAEDIQLRMTQPFSARGEKELESKLATMPWHCYLPDPERHSDLQFKMPQTRAKSFKSKLFHTQLIRDILIDAITETQVRKEFKQ